MNRCAKALDQAPAIWRKGEHISREWPTSECRQSRVLACHLMHPRLGIPKMQGAVNFGCRQAGAIRRESHMGVTLVGKFGERANKLARVSLADFNPGAR